MATNTPNYNLIKPAGTDPVNIADLNNNADIIDTTLKSLDNRILPIATQAQAQEGTSNNTLTTPLRVYESIASKSTSVTNLNDLTRAGSYFMGNTTGLVNKPANTFNSAAHIVVYNNTNQTIPTQIYFSVNEGRHFIRSRNGFTPSDAWNAWRELGRNISTSAQAKTGTDDTTVMSPVKVKESINNSPISRYGTATGTNALVITANPLFDDLYTGLTVKFKNTTANTGNVTINVNSKGVKSVLNNDGTQIKPGKLKASSLYEITYDGTNFYLTKGGGEESPISKVTRGSTTISSSSLSSQVTLPQFNVNKSVLKISVTTSSASVTGTSTATNVLARIVDNTTISFTRNATSINNLIVYWELIEYEDYVNIQKGISDLSTNSLTVPISAVNSDKSVIYFSYDSSTNGEYAQMTSGHLNSSSELLFRRGSDAGINKISWFVVEIA